MKLSVARKWNVTEALEKIDVFPTSHSWRFAQSKVSGAFETVLGPDWATMVYAPYFSDWWAPILLGLEKRSKPTEILLSVRYRLGVWEEREAMAALGYWRTAEMTVVGEVDDTARNPVMGIDCSGEGEVYVMGAATAQDEGMVMVTMVTLLGFTFSDLTL